MLYLSMFYFLYGSQREDSLECVTVSSFQQVIFSHLSALSHARDALHFMTQSFSLPHLFTSDTCHYLQLSLGSSVIHLHFFIVLFIRLPLRHVCSTHTHIFIFPRHHRANGGWQAGPCVERTLDLRCLLFRTLKEMKENR